MPTVTLTSLDTDGDIDSLYGRVEAALGNVRGGALILDMSGVPFVAVQGVLAVINVARYWQGETGGRTTLAGMRRPVHQYLERIDLFTHANAWLSADDALAASERFFRVESSPRLLEISPIAGDDRQNECDVQGVVQRARRIIRAWFDTDSPSVDRLLTMLVEVATNVVHSRNYGFVAIQRYRDPSDSPFGSRVVISITDLGIGIEQALRERPMRLPAWRRSGLRIGSDYIRIALKIGITSRAGAGGLGLNRVRTLVGHWRGVLTIRSGRSKVWIDGDALKAADGLALMPGTQVTIAVRGPADDDRGDDAGPPF